MVCGYEGRAIDYLGEIPPVGRRAHLSIVPDLSFRSRSALFDERATTLKTDE